MRARVTAAVIHIQRIRAAAGNIDSAKNIVQHAAGVVRLLTDSGVSVGRVVISCDKGRRRTAETDNVRATASIQIFNCQRRVTLNVNRIIMIT